MLACPGVVGGWPFASSGRFIGEMADLATVGTIRRSLLARGNQSGCVDT